jgi:type II secretory pathway pseudopilin PulG
MKLVAIVILFALIVFLGFQIFVFIGREREAQQAVSDFKNKLDAAKLDADRSRAELNYYSNPSNLEKELRARYNYRAPDEKMMILVTRASTSLSSTPNSL